MSGINGAAKTLRYMNVGGGSRASRSFLSSVWGVHPRPATQPPYRYELVTWSDVAASASTVCR
jgi:hypothetical protein